MDEQYITLNNIELTYLFKEKKYDSNHLIVVFSGFGGKSQFTYDFKNALSLVRANVLWIKDDFHKKTYASYYLDPINSEKKTIENAVHDLILLILKKCNLTKEHCTFLGCSKGGAAALYYGLKYNIKNLVVSAPSLLIGSSISGKIPKRKAKVMAEHLLGSINDDSIQKLDSLILTALTEDKELDKNIYLLAAKVDPLFDGHIKPYLHEFLKYRNFNYIQSDSVFITSHPDVTSHNAPLIVSILTQLSFNLIPTYTTSIISGEPLDLISQPSLEPVVELHSLTFDKSGKLYPEGVGLLRGVHCPEYADVNYNLVFKTESKSYKVRLAKSHKPKLSLSFYKDRFVNYSKNFFCSAAYSGLLLDSIPEGEYMLLLEIITPQAIRIEPLKPSPQTLIDTPKELKNKLLFTKNNAIYYSYTSPSIKD